MVALGMAVVFAGCAAAPPKPAVEARAVEEPSAQVPAECAAQRRPETPPCGWPGASATEHWAFSSGPSKELATARAGPVGPGLVVRRRVDRGRSRRGRGLPDRVRGGSNPGRQRLER